MTNKTAKTTADYVAALPEGRRAFVARLLAVIRDNAPAGVEEVMAYGMPGFSVSRSVYPAGYHCDRSQLLPYMGVGSQKQGVSLYAFCVYLDPALKTWFEAEYVKTGKRMDMGKGCIRFKKESDVPWELLAETVRRVPLAEFIAAYEAQIPPSAKARK
jgi:uncharacterized protein YdhG (YjbR/CyaY superfamily)